MAYRYTEKELADIQARQNTNLSSFQRNSGRGLPPATVRSMERSQGVKLDADGAALPVPIPQTRSKKRKSGKKPLAETLHQPKHPVGRILPRPARMRKLESDVAKSIEAGEKAVSTSSGLAVNVPRIANAQAPAIARYRKRCECDGIQFDSQLEMRRYKELKLLKAAGEIKYFLRQVPFHLPGNITYRADFMVVHWIRTAAADVNTAWCFVEYEDCKAAPGKRSKGRYNDHDRAGVNKRKQVKALYGVEVKLVHKARG